MMVCQKMSCGRPATHKWRVWCPAGHRNYVRCQWHSKTHGFDLWSGVCHSCWYADFHEEQTGSVAYRLRCLDKECRNYKPYTTPTPEPEPVSADESEHIMIISRKIDGFVITGRFTRDPKFVYHGSGLQ